VRRLLGLLALLMLPALAWSGRWEPIAKDGLRDPKGPAIGILQEPREGLGEIAKLAPDTAGNQVRWVEALEKGVINPRSNLLPGTQINVLDQDILLNLKGGMPIVRFPHRAHTLWLDCSNCHEHLFKSKFGANKLSMFSILQGEQCGVCHGAVSFPLTECNRCHSVPRINPAPAAQQ
jgi:c(7)-type cytochrome triheme protein